MPTAHSGTFGWQPHLFCLYPHIYKCGQQPLPPRVVVKISHGLGRGPSLWPALATGEPSLLLLGRSYVRQVAGWTKDVAATACGPGDLGAVQEVS